MLYSAVSHNIYIFFCKKKKKVAKIWNEIRISFSYQNKLSYEKLFSSFSKKNGHVEMWAISLFSQVMFSKRQQLSAFTRGCRTFIAIYVTYLGDDMSVG